MAKQDENGVYNDTKPAGTYQDQLAPLESPLRYERKVVLVTGGSKGIGQGIVRAFANAGSNVVFCARGEDCGRELEDDVNSLGRGEARFVMCDVTDTQQINNLVTTAVQTYGRLDCLVNNAGGYSSFGSIDESSEADFIAALQLNLVSNFVACKNALPHLRKAKGNIINVASLGAVIGDVGSVAHIAAKGGVIAMTKALAVDESKYGVRVNCLSPAHVRTAMWQDIAERRDTQAKQFIREAEDHHLLGRMGTPEECGKACLFLAADATFSTGTNMLLGGGADLNYANKSRLHFM